jgi:hypothetical protein
MSRKDAKGRVDMKRSVVLLLVLGLLFGSLVGAADAKKKKKKKPPAPVKVTREVQGSYAAPAGAVGLCSQDDAIGCVVMTSGVEESYLTAKVTDAHGQPVAVAVKSDLDGDNASETLWGTFCGETTEPIQIQPGAEIIFWIGITPDTADDGCSPGEGTQGTVDVVFSNMI